MMIDVVVSVVLGVSAVVVLLGCSTFAAPYRGASGVVDEYQGDRG